MRSDIFWGWAMSISASHCPPISNTNASNCYGIADADMNSVMGGGMRLDVVHATAWVEAMRAFVRAEPRSPLYTPQPRFVKRFGVSKQRLYPRTTAEFEAGTVLKTLPAGR